MPKPGTELRKLIKELGLKEYSGCGCAAKARQMDKWGPGGCVLHRAEIIAWLDESASKAGWGETLVAAGKAAAMGIFSVGGLLDEAIRRAEPPASPG